MELVTSEEQIPLIDHCKNDFDPKYTFYTRRFRYRRKARIEKYQCIFCTIILSILFLTFTGTIIHSIQRNSYNDSISEVKESNTTENEMDLNNLNEAYNYSLLLMNNLIELENNSYNVPISSPIFKHQKAIYTTQKANDLSKFGFIEQSITKYLLNNTKHVKELQKHYNLYLEKLAGISEHCFSKVNLKCLKTKYRSYNGSCNNLQNPNKNGVAFNPFRRALPAVYADEIEIPRKSIDGSELPSARNISLFVHRPSYRSDLRFTVMFAVFGQFLDHDITATALSQKFNGQPINCCDDENNDHPNCYPIKIAKEDSYYQTYNVTCVDFSRSAPALTCCFGAREQLNQASSFIDGSAIYNSDEQIVNNLRLHKNGLLKMLIVNNRSLLPISDDLNDGCNRNEMNRRGRYCFMTGDGRANENLHLTTLHLIWARHHNYLAKNLYEINPHWNDEKLFQESRRILIAQLQHITYNEFLPILFGSNVMKKYHLNSQESGYFHDYDRTLDATIANNFAAASFRFAHTLIPGLIRFLNKHKNSSEDIELHKVLFNPYKLYDADSVDSIVLGALQTNIELFDSHFNTELKNHLFESNDKAANKVSVSKSCGLDLVTLNIQRGRDHGLPPYTSWRQYCRFKKPKKFSDLNNVINKESLKLISTIYK